MNPTRTSQDDLILIFGPQDLSFDRNFAKTLRTTLLESSSSQWIVQALLDLPRHWKTLEAAVDGLRESGGVEHLDALIDWLRLGGLPDAQFPLPNVLLTPLVVVSQLTQYTHFVKKLYLDMTLEAPLQYLSSRRTETVGLCTGFVSAAAVASSSSLRDLTTHGAVAIRLAMALGAVVDASEHHTEATKEY
jgi:hypothetical protein